MKIKTRIVFALALAALFSANGAKAMSFDDFARMNNDDEAGFVTFLIETSAQMLKTNGHPEQADKVVAFFKDPSPNGGVHQLASQLRSMNNINIRNSTNPNNRAYVYQVEDAMASTLKDDGIIVPASYLLAASQNFQPSGPPRQHNPGP
ncbi:MAG: hypothetical protein LV481_03020 [Methylacidiphilales bacterium]|nr:hypothetical protein [Candidatus Methylacidiphilales bacterium]